MAQLVIAWTIAQPGITHALCGVRNPEQALENAKAGNTALSAQELEAMDQIIAKHASGIV
jgi:methylglyoxal reductase